MWLCLETQHLGNVVYDEFVIQQLGFDTVYRGWGPHRNNHPVFQNPRALENHIYSGVYLKRHKASLSTVLFAFAVLCIYVYIYIHTHMYPYIR
jgi:hypothetical protein